MFAPGRRRRGVPGHRYGGREIDRQRRDCDRGVCGDLLGDAARHRRDQAAAGGGELLSLGGVGCLEVFK
jgi:hypothetical protein